MKQDIAWNTAFVYGILVVLGIFWFIIDTTSEQDAERVRQTLVPLPQKTEIPGTTVHVICIDGYKFTVLEFQGHISPPVQIFGNIQGRGYNMPITCSEGK